MKIKILAFVFLLLTIWTCSSPEGPKVRYIYYTLRIKGTVTDSTDNSPIINGTVTLNIGFYGADDYARLNDAGEYTIIHEHSGYYSCNENYMSLEVEADGFKSKRITHDDENYVRCTEEWQTINIQLESDSGGM